MTTTPDPRTPHVPGQPTFADFQAEQGTTGRVDPDKLGISGLTDDERAAFLPPPTYSPPPKKKRRLWLIALAVVALFFVIAGIIAVALAGQSGTGSLSPGPGEIVSIPPPTEPTVEPTTEATTPPAAKATPTAKPLSAEQQNAIEAAQSYLDSTAFSRKGLIQQLHSDAGEGYPLKVATYAVDSLHVNWNEQAYRSAKSYLEYSSFSRKELIRQLSSDAGEGFTYKQAVYGVTKAGL